MSVFYVFTEGSVTNRIPTNITRVNTSSVTIHNVITGFKYTFNVTAENSNGSSSIMCGPTFHVIGQSLMYIANMYNSCLCLIFHA